MKKFYRQLYRQRYLILMMLPGLLWFLIFKYCTYAGLGLAFTNYGFKLDRKKKKYDIPDTASERV